MERDRCPPRERRHRSRSGRHHRGLRPRLALQSGASGSRRFIQGASGSDAGTDAHGAAQTRTKGARRGRLAARDRDRGRASPGPRGRRAHSIARGRRARPHGRAQGLGRRDSDAARKPGPDRRYRNGAGFGRALGGRSPCRHAVRDRSAVSRRLRPDPRLTWRAQGPASFPGCQGRARVSLRGPCLGAWTRDLRQGQLPWCDGDRVEEARQPLSAGGVGVAKRTDIPVAATPTVSREIHIAGVKLTHPTRMLYPDVGITKLDLARFYEHIGERMLPHLVDRPLTLVRAPNGIGGQRFFVRHAGDWAPPELRQYKITGGTGAGTTMIVDDLRGLVALAQMNVLEIHPWNARTSDIERPDRMVFDLDPGPEVPWSDIVDGAKRVREVLETLDLASFVKTTGGKGLHVLVPLTPAATWEETLEFS